MKEILQLSLEKYYLGGLCPKSQVDIENKMANFSFISEEKNLVGFIKSPLDLQPKKIGIYDTEQLLKILNITSDNIKTEINRNPSAEVLLISDENYNLQYILSDIKLIPNIPDIEEPNYTLSHDLTQELLLIYTKAFKALKPERCKIHHNAVENKINFVLGEGDYSNSVEFELKSLDDKLSFSNCYFPPNIINEIFDKNKNMESGKIEIFDEGFMKIYFVEKGIESTYFIPGLDIDN
jgi:hypothetical protein